MEQENNQQPIIDIENTPKEQLGNYMIVQDYRAEKYLYVKLNSEPGTSWAVSVMGKTLKVKTGRERLLAFYYYTNDLNNFNYILGQVIDGEFRPKLGFINAFKEVFEQTHPATQVSKFSWKMIPGYATEKTPFSMGYGGISISKEEEEKLLKEIWNHKRGAFGTTRKWIRTQTYDYINNEPISNEGALTEGLLKMYGINVEQLEAHDPDDDLLFVPDDDLSEHEINVQITRFKDAKRELQYAIFEWWFALVTCSIVTYGLIKATEASGDGEGLVIFFLPFGFILTLLSFGAIFVILALGCGAYERKEFRKVKQSIRKSILDRIK